VRNLRIALVCIETNPGKLALAQHPGNVPNPELKQLCTFPRQRNWSMAKYDWIAV